VDDKHIRRMLLILSWANWAIAVVAWTISAYLGIASPARIFVYTILFLVGIFAVVVAVACFLLEKFAHRPEQIARLARVRHPGDDGPMNESAGAGSAAGSGA